jgi:predicted deacylase
MSGPVQDERDAIDTIEMPPAGTRRRGHLRFSAPLLEGWAWPYTVIRGAADGPRLVVTSGVHPAEYPAIEANIRFARDLDPRTLRGTVISLPIVDLPAFLERTPFVCPIDQKNPNRCMPGDPNGTFTDVLCDAVFRNVMSTADAVIDLHGGDMTEALVPFSIYAQGADEAVNAKARDLGLAYGLPYLVGSSPETGGTGGTTVRALADAGIPAILTEAGACGLLTEAETAQHEAGLVNVLRHLDMIDGDPAPPLTPIIELGRMTPLRSPAEGMWYSEVVVGDPVSAGDRAGSIGNLFGDKVADVVIADDGYVLYLSSSPAMRKDGLTVVIGSE